MTRTGLLRLQKKKNPIPWSLINTCFEENTQTKRAVRSIHVCTCNKCGVLCVCIPADRPKYSEVYHPEIEFSAIRAYPCSVWQQARHSCPLQFDPVPLLHLASWPLVFSVDTSCVLVPCHMQGLSRFSSRY